jgi:uncharacterized protein
MTNKDLQILEKEMPPFAEAHGMTYVAVFGSTARGEQTEKSDIDFLVTFEKPISLVKLITIQRKMTRKFKRKVDLVTENALSARIKPYVIKDLKVLYEGR